VKRRNASARALESPLFRQKVIDMRKKQRRAAEKAAAKDWEPHRGTPRQSWRDPKVTDIDWK
jgi:stalled ribosome alternative rescue factor ArfA